MIVYFISLTILFSLNYPFFRITNGVTNVFDTTLFESYEKMSAFSDIVVTQPNVFKVSSKVHTS